MLAIQNQKTLCRKK